MIPASSPDRRSDFSFDLRSDTLTKPTTGMRAAIAAAEVGDAFYDEDPSVLRLEAQVAELFGMEAALFMPSGTMSNQIALKLHCQPGEAVLVSPSNHIVQYETGALAAVGGIQHMPVPLVDGLYPDCAALADFVVPPQAIHAPTSRVLALENTHLRSGGRVVPLEALRAAKRACGQLGLALHLDGARIWHAHVREKTPLRAYGDVCDTLSVCFSKGLGAPVGSCLLASRLQVAQAKRLRKMLGGSMRQCGLLAAAASYALENNVARLQDDHECAALLAETLRRALPGAEIADPETNVLLIVLDRKRYPDPAAVLAMLLERHSLRLSALDSRTLRAVTHLDVSTPAFREHLGSMVR